MLVSTPIFIAALTGIGTLAIGALLADWLAKRTDLVAKSIEDTEGESNDRTARVVRGLGKTFRPLAAPFDKLSAGLDRDLTYAGRPYGGVSGEEYLAAAIALSISAMGAFGLVFGLMGLSDGGSIFDALKTTLRLVTIFTPFALGYFIMDIRTKAGNVAWEIEREFPFFLDLAILVVQAGGTPRQALSKFVEASPGTPLSREIAITSKDADATSFADALHRLIERLEPKSVRTILKNLAQGERSSGQVEEFYTDQAKELRYLREEMANRSAERLKANIALPVFMMLFSIIIAALAPTIVNITAQGII